LFDPAGLARSGPGIVGSASRQFGLAARIVVGDAKAAGMFP